MLTVVLTRPRLRWMELLTDESPSRRLWAERALTIFAFAMGGYAWAALFIVLYKQLDVHASAMLKGSAGFLIAYAWLIHFEPFVSEWRLSGWAGAAILYTGVAAFAASVGIFLAESLLTSSFVFSNCRILLLTGAIACGTWILYRLIPRIETLLRGSDEHKPHEPAGSAPK